MGVRSKATFISHKFRELWEFLTRLPAETDVIFLVLGVDGLTTEIGNLAKLRRWCPLLNICLVVMVDKSFERRIHDGQWARQDDPDAIDLFPPTSFGMRLRTFQLDDLLERRTRQARELLELWRTIQWGKRSVNLSWMIQNTGELTERRQTWQPRCAHAVYQASQQVPGVPEWRMGIERYHQPSHSLTDFGAGMFSNGGVFAGFMVAILDAVQNGLFVQMHLVESGRYHGENGLLLENMWRIAWDWALFWLGKPNSC